MTKPMRAIGVLCAVAMSCSLLSTRIADIKDQPGRFDGRSVTVSGTVTGSVNLLVVKYFTVRDESGEINVVTQGALPREGEKVRVKGTVDQAFKLAGASVVVIVEQPPSR